MSKNLDAGFSIYLDIIRFAAALVVMFSHVWPLLFPNFPLPWPGHAAVVVFFVLSGYVIAFATDRPDQIFSQYATHRAVRILSVTIPALLLSICIAPVAGGNKIPFAGPLSIPGDEFWSAIFLNAVFLGESWFGSVTPPFNPPYWSLSYEVWYYAIFGAWVFCSPKWKWPAAVTLTLLAGIKIAILLPIWLMGVILYRTPLKLAHRHALILFITSAVVGLLFFWFDYSVKIRTEMTQLFPDFMRMLHGSNQFIGDSLLGLIVSANFIAAGSMGKYFAWLRYLEKPIRYLASFTLSIYLFHLPLTVLIWNGFNVQSTAGFCAMMITGIFILGSLTERKNKNIRHWVERQVAWARKGRDKPAIS